jgi:hypothetical protein
MIGFGLLLAFNYHSVAGKRNKSNQVYLGGRIEILVAHVQTRRRTFVISVSSEDVQWNQILEGT